MSDYYYTGCFLDSKSNSISKGNRIGKPLSKQNEILHMTIQFKPEFVDESLFGESVKIRVIGYGIDDDNEGYLVEAFSDNELLQRMIDSIEIPHITLSISETGRHRNTRNLDFKPLEPFELTGVYGGYILDKENDCIVLEQRKPSHSSVLKSEQL